GDQILNAESFEKQGYASVLYEEDVTMNSLIKHVEELDQNNEVYKRALKKYNGEEAIKTIIKHISEA
ncbi:UDP-N-acetylglucosamine--N-acetylmuramyl-(pentapeptide) pyrophosphoryl-undecaprenol N-acetylglucosamine transferase, partial [Bacillus cereus]